WQRALIKAFNGERFFRKMLYAQARQSCKKQMAELSQQNLHQRKQLSVQYQRLTWADWLKQQALRGNALALGLLRSREQAQGLRGDTIKAVNRGRKLEQFLLPIDNITKQGTVIFRTEGGSIRDDGDKLQVSQAADDKVIAVALRLALSRFGNEIIVEGSERFKAQVLRMAVNSKMALTFADAELDMRRRELFYEARAASLKNDDSPKHRL
ncbi:MAG: LPD7 domain-containing protein, partial [Vibrionaceae bacterium]